MYLGYLTRAFDDSCHLRQFCQSDDVEGIVRDNDDEPPFPSLPQLHCRHNRLDDVVPLRRQIVPPSIYLEAWVQGSHVTPEKER